MKKTISYIANRLWLIVVIYLLSILFSSLLFAFFEERTLIDSLWWSFISALTIGYGDISPLTLGGKLVGILFGHFWIFGVIPLIISNLIINFIEDKNEFTHDEQEDIKNKLADIVNKLTK